MTHSPHLMVVISLNCPIADAALTAQEVTHLHEQVSRARLVVSGEPLILDGDLADWL